ncbi:MAG: hypothetical protein JO316_12955 [Abitibacteriaceae bacterium]|nr:hypothetical protein [Abditibacteriaceae bacterium]
MYVTAVKRASLIALLSFSLTSNSYAQQGETAAKANPTVPEAVTITVVPGARQTFQGFGTSLGNWGGEYQKLQPVERMALSRLLWHDLKFKILRLWFNTDQYAPERGGHNLQQFRKNYVDSRIIADAKQQGATTLLLAPDGLPPYMKEKRADGGLQLKESEVANYADLLADFIQRLKDETGVLLDVTGVQNEPNDNERFTPQQIVEVVKYLRTALDARGLNTVKIIAPEHASADAVLYDSVDKLKADNAAWQVLSGVASHSYNMAATNEIAQRVAGTSKAYWMTEASDNGPEEPGDAVRATSLASRFLNDMNHRVTHWIHFLGFEVPDPKDNATRIMSFTPNPLHPTLFQKYFYYQQLSNTFDVGAVFRQSQSSLEGDMIYTYGKKPRLTVAAARNPDGSWGIGLSNFTAPQFSDATKTGKWEIDQGGYAAHTFKVTVRIEELAKLDRMMWQRHRSSATAQNANVGTVIMHNGEVTVEVSPLELLTLRSQPVAQ